MTRRTILVAVPLAAILLTAGCTGSGPPLTGGSFPDGVRGCTPIVEIEPEVVEPGGEIVVRGEVPGCEMEFAGERSYVLTLRVVDPSISEVEVTVAADSDDGFQQSMTVPLWAEAGGFVSVAGFEWTCHDTGSCAEVGAGFRIAK